MAVEMKPGSQTVPDALEKISIPEFYYVALTPDLSSDQGTTFNFKVNIPNFSRLAIF